MTRVSNFFLGLLISVALMATMILCIQIGLKKIGELDIHHVIDVQNRNNDALFLSGINQKTFSYKTHLAKDYDAQVVLIGSSRAMQVRNQFFIKKFFNYGGAVNSVSQLEALAEKALNLNKNVEMAIIFLDPWWFNSEFVKNSTDPPMDSYPEWISTGIIWDALLLLQKGDWITRSFRSDNLGIQAILTESGYAKDGSFYENEVTTGKRPPLDSKFLDTLKRINNGDQRFEKSNVADSILLGRGCNAVNLIADQIPHIVLVLPPFAPKVWSAMRMGGYGYLDNIKTYFDKCNSNIPIFDYHSSQDFTLGSDCEFMDGFHAGDVVNARLLQSLAKKSVKIRESLNSNFIAEFIGKNSGYSNGLAREKFPNFIEVDYLALGCKK